MQLKSGGDWQLAFLFGTPLFCASLLTLYPQYHPQAGFSRGSKMVVAVPDLTSALYTIWIPEFPRPEILCGLNKVMGQAVNQPVGAGVVYHLCLDYGLTLYMGGRRN